jgi:hypothetical protein
MAFAVRAFQSQTNQDGAMMAFSDTTFAEGPHFFQILELGAPTSSMA